MKKLLKEDNSMEIDDDSYIDRLVKLRKEEASLVDKLIAERIFLANTIRIDPLTGLYNRRIFPKIRDIGTVVMCDIDNFKSVNDTFGHDIGDKAIQAVGITILDNIRVGDVGCRYGGDEFLIVFTTDLKEVVENRMRKISRDIQRNFSLPCHDITLSVGIAINKDNSTLAELIEQADDALAKSKENGKNQISYYEKQKVFRKKRSN